MYDFSKATDTEQYFRETINALNGSKIVGIYNVCPTWFYRGHFIYEQDDPVFIIFDNGYCLVLEYNFINELNVEYRKMTERERQSYDKAPIKDLFNRTTEIHNTVLGKITSIEKSAFSYAALERVEIKRVMDRRRHR